MTTHEVSVFDEDTEWEVRYTRDERVLWRSISAVVLFVPPHRDEPLRLVGAGRALWELLGEPRSVRDAARALSEAYRVPVDIVVRDIVPIIDELTTLRVLTRLEPA